MFFFWASEARIILWAEPEGRPLVVAPSLFAGLMEESPFCFTETSATRSVRQPRGRKTVVMQPIWESVLVRKHQELAC